MAQVVRFKDTSAARRATLASRTRDDHGNPGLRSTSPGDLRRGCAVDRVSDAEIGQLVSVALEDALIALGNDDPEEFLRLRARQARAGMHESFASLPYAQRTDATIVSEYRKAIGFRNVACELALSLVSAVKGYAEACGREAPSDID